MVPAFLLGGNMILAEIVNQFAMVRALYDDDIVKESTIIYAYNSNDNKINDVLETIAIRNIFVTDMVKAIHDNAIYNSDSSKTINDFIYFIISVYPEICTDRIGEEMTVGLVTPAIIDSVVEEAYCIELYMKNIPYEVKSIPITNEVYEKLENEFYIFSEAVDSAYCRKYNNYEQPSKEVTLMKNLFVGKKLKDFPKKYVIGEDLIEV